MRIRRRVWSATWVLAVAVGCLGPAQWRYEEAIEAAPAAAAHAVHEAQLAVLMRNLDRLHTERLPKAFDLRWSEERQVLEMARVARAMAESAARIPAAEPVGLDAGQQAEFRALAAELQRLAEGLADDAGGLSPEQRRARVAQIDATCARCHARFRIPKPRHDFQM